MNAMGYLPVALFFARFIVVLICLLLVYYMCKGNIGEIVL